MKCFASHRLFRWFFPLAMVATGYAEVLNVGDFQRLDHWSGLAASDRKTPAGDPVAILKAPGRAAFEYTEPKTYVGWETPAFSDLLDEVAVENWFDYRYLEFEVQLPDAQAAEIEVTLYPLKIGRPDYQASVSSSIRLKGAGWQQVLLPLRDFDFKHHQGAFWRVIKGVSIDCACRGEVLIGQPRIKTGKAVSLTSAVKSKPVEPGETAVYDLVVENESGVPRQVALRVEESGWEACPATLSETQFELAPGERKTVSLSVEMNASVAPGGRESRTVGVVPDGRGDLREALRFITVRRLPHPYLLHTEAGWRDVAQKAETVDWARDARDELVAAARKWRVPSIGTGTYCYSLSAAQEMAECAIAWKLSGDEGLAEKALQFLKDFSNPETGYPTKIRSNKGAHVHQGMFFIHLARGYDLLYDHEGLAPRDHRNLERCFRLYSHWVDADLMTGDGNNHQAGLVAGALLNSLVMQDFSEVERYLHGTGGYVDLLGQGILDDGHYFEGTANYNILTANLANSVAIAFDPWGMEVKNWKIPAKYGKYVMVSDWAMRGEFLGMNFERQGPSTRTYRSLKDLWDAVLPMADYRGVVFATSDSVSIDLTSGKNEAGFGYDMAYYMWRDPAYVPLLQRMKKRDLLYGVVDLPAVDGALGAESYCADNIGFAVLRSKAAGRPERERIQTVQRYGTHGGYHGHFDKTSLASLSRFGRFHYGTEASWYGYWSFMFKMWVQTSDAHNMAVVDHRMQKPADNRRILFHSGDLMQVSATEIETEWIDPPYGGQTPYALKMPEEKTWQEGRWLPTPENPRPQGDTGTPSEPILQRRLIVTTDDYVLMADYLKGTQPHDFDNLFNCKGLVDLSAGTKRFVKHTAQCDPDPYGSAQFITDCNWYETAGTVKAGFVLDWSKGEMGGRQSCSEPGVMNVDYYSLWPKQAGVMVGNYAESLEVARQLFYRVTGDGQLLAEGQFAPWILGKAVLDLEVGGVETLAIETRVEKAKSPKTVFLGNPQLLDAAGRPIPFDVETDNVAETAGENLDYAGGAVTLFGEHYATSLAAEPNDRKKSGVLRIDLTGKNAVRFKAVLGGDYPVGGDDIHRKIIATRSSGKEARFLSAVELHEDRPVIESIVAHGADDIEVVRTDGKVDRFKISGLEGPAVAVEMTVEEGGRITASEKTSNRK